MPLNGILRNHGIRGGCRRPGEDDGEIGTLTVQQLRVGRRALRHPGAMRQGPCCRGAVRLVRGASAIKSVLAGPVILLRRVERGGRRGAEAPERGRAGRAAAGQSYPTQSVFKVVLRKSSPHEFVYLFFILVGRIVNDKFTNLWGS